MNLLLADSADVAVPRIIHKKVVRKNQAIRLEDPQHLASGCQPHKRVKERTEYSGLVNDVEAGLFEWQFGRIPVNKTELRAEQTGLSKVFVDQIHPIHEGGIRIEL
ncbi:MAG: hypothetical protein WA581_11980 [Candidatus Acidiferrales bacterium]